MSDLRGLIERCEKATGPDRELDGRIAVVDGLTFGFCGDDDGSWRCGCAAGDCGSPIGLWDERKSYPSDWRDDERLPRYTASVDAALALVEKMRPGYRWGVSSVAIKIGAHPDGKTAYGEGFRAHVTKNSPLRPMPSTADAPTPALAIILALLRALDSQGAWE